MGRTWERAGQIQQVIACFCSFVAHGGTPILSSTNQIVARRFSTSLEHLEVVPTAIASVNPARIRTVCTDRSYALRPNTRLTFAVLALCGCLLFGFGLSTKYHLVGKAENLPGPLRINCQRVVQQKSTSASVADRPQPFGVWMACVVEFRGILDHQHNVTLLCLLSCGLPMRCLKCLQGHILLVEESIPGFGAGPTDSLFRNTRRRVCNQSGPQCHRPAGPPSISQLRFPKLCLRPSLRIIHHTTTH